jgi:hypothetical protein
MADDRYDQLLQIRQQANQKMAEAAVQQIAREYQSHVQNAYEMAAAQKWDDAGYHLRELLRLENEARPYVQAAQQPQSRYTEAEQSLMPAYPDEIRRNWNTALAASRNLVASKLQADPEADQWAYRNSAEYIRSVAHACGILNSDGTESNEGPLTPNMVCEICKIDADTYNRGAQRLIEDKRAGKYPMGQS